MFRELILDIGTFDVVLAQTSESTNQKVSRDISLFHDLGDDVSLRAQTF